MCLRQSLNVTNTWLFLEFVSSLHVSRILTRNHTPCPFSDDCDSSNHTITPHTHKGTCWWFHHMATWCSPKDQSRAERGSTRDAEPRVYPGPSTSRKLSAPGERLFFLTASSTSPSTMTYNQGGRLKWTKKNMTSLNNNENNNNIINNNLKNP